MYCVRELSKLRVLLANVLYHLRLQRCKRALERWLASQLQVNWNLTATRTAGFRFPSVKQQEDSCYTIFWSGKRKQRSQKFCWLELSDTETLPQKNPWAFFNPNIAKYFGVTSPPPHFVSLPFSLATNKWVVSELFCSWPHTGSIYISSFKLMSSIYGTFLP